MALAFIALGSNVGDRDAHLSYARAELEDLGALEAVSSVYETAPVGGPAQGPFLNQVVALDTAAEPEALLRALLTLERARGRRRDAGVPNGPRTLDLDLLFYDDRAIRTASLTVPHPRLHERRFVLEPLAEIAPDHVHPTLFRSARALLAACADGAKVERWTPDQPKGAPCTVPTSPTESGSSSSS